MLCILPHPVDCQLHRIVRGMQVDINCPSVRLRQLPVRVKLVLEELVFMFCNPDIDVNGIYAAKFINGRFEGGTLGLP